MKRECRVDDTEGHLQSEIRGPTKLVKMRGGDEIDGQLEGANARMRECGDAVESIRLRVGVNAIRETRIAWLSGHSLITFGIKGWQPVRFQEDCEPGGSGIIFRKARQP